LQTLKPSGFWRNKPTSGNVPLASLDGRNAFLVYAKVNLADGTDGPVRIESWRLARGGRSHRSRWLGGTGIVAATALRGDRVIYATDNQVVTWDAKTEKPIRTVAGPTFQPNECGNCVISPDGRFLAWGDLNGTIHFFNIAKRTTVASLGAHSASVQRIAFSPDSGTVVSTGDDGVAIVWNPVTGRPLERLTGHSGRVLGADFSPDGKLLYTAGLDGTILEYDLGGGRRFGSPFKLSQAGTPLGPDAVQPSTPLLAASPNGRLFAASAVGGGAGQSTVELYRVAPLRRLPPIALPTGRSVGAGAWSGNRLVLGANRGLVQFWKVAGGRAHPGALLRGLSPRSKVRAIATAGGGRVVAALASYYGPAKPGQSPPVETEFALWRDGRLVGGKAVKLPGGEAVALTADGKTAAVSADAPPERPVPVRIVDTSTGKVERTLSVPHASGSVTALAFAPDDTLATGTYSGIVNLWNPKTGQTIGQRMLVAPFPVASIAFSPDGRTFATTGSAGVSIWDTATRQQLGSNLPGGDGLWGKLAYTPDGRHLLSAFTDGSAFVWPVTLKAWERQACTVAHRNFTAEEWRRFVSGRSYSRVCR
jgi:WD40 repeat protein